MNSTQKQLPPFSVFAHLAPRTFVSPTWVPVFPVFPMIPIVYGQIPQDSLENSFDDLIILANVASNQ